MTYYVYFDAYGHAKQTCKGASLTFGKGDVRGVIAPESANNAKQGGALVPTLAFGVPGSAAMALLLGAFMIQGIQPGPDMLIENLDLVYTIVWSTAIANVMATGIALLLTNPLAKISAVRIQISALGPRRRRRRGAPRRGELRACDFS